MTRRNLFTIITMVVLMLSMLSNPYGTMGTSATPGDGATISNISMADNNQIPDEDPNLMKESFENVESERPFTKSTMDYHEIRASLDSIYQLQGNNLYAGDQSHYDSSVKQLNQLLVSFSSMDARTHFINQLPEGTLVKAYSYIPSVVINNNQQVRDILLSSQTITDLVGDVIFDLPEFEALDTENKDIAHYNSEAHIGAPQLRELGFTGEGVTVSVLDTGIDNTHHDLALTTNGLPKVIAEESFVPGEDTSDFIGHGTHVAGTVAGNGDHIGVAPGAQLLNAKVCGPIGCATSWMVDAIEWSIAHDVDVITMSIGGSTILGIDPLDQIIDYAWQNGIIVTIAAGNAGPSQSTVSSPGVGPRVITVGATDVYDKVTYFSGRGPSVYGEFDPDISAPGSGVFSTLPGDSYGIYDGTSMATPHVAGATALLLEAHPKAENNEIKSNLMANAADMEGFSANEQGSGLVDLLATHENWDKRRSVVFPTLTQDDVFYMTPGESYTGIFSFVRGSLGFVPTFNLDSNDAFSIDVEKFALKPQLEGHQFVPFTLTVPQDANVGDVLERTITLSYLPYKKDLSNKYFLKEEMKVVIEVVDHENDANLGFDASDTFIGATEIPISTFEAFAADMDFYKVEFQEGHTYQITLSGMSGNSDFDLAVYNDAGELSCTTCNFFLGGTTPEFVELTAEYTGYYYIRVDPWSVLYLDPFISNFDSTGTYALSISEGGSPPGEGSGTQFDFIEAVVYGQDNDGDGVNENMQVDITVDVTSTGLLDAYAFLALDKGGPTEKWFFATAFIEFHEFTTTGIQTVSLSLDSMYFADQNFNGPVVIYELFMGDPSTFTILYDLFDVYTSPAMNSADFGSTHMTYNYLNSQPLDEDGDGIGDYLEVEVSVDISTTFEWFSYFQATLYHPDEGYIYSLNPSEVDLSSSGTALMYFVFDPNDFITDDTDPFDLELIITYSFEHPMRIDTQHFGSFPYILTIGDTVPIDPADYGTTSSTEIVHTLDYGLDSDGDGKYDNLIIDVTVSIAKAGYYSVTFHPWLWSTTDQEVLFDFESDPFQTMQWLDPGEHVMTMSINGELIEAMEIDLPLMVLAIWLDYWEEGPFGMEYISTPDTLQNYKTNSYQSSDFDVSGLNFLGISGLNYVDLTGDGAAETIELQLDVDVGYTGEFYLFMYMINYPILGAFINEISDNFYFFEETGTQTISVYIDGTEFYREKYIGYMEIWELDLINAGTFDFTYFDFQNGLFWVDYTQLPGAAPPGDLISISDYGVDSNGNGLYEGVVIDVTIEVSREANFYMYMDVFGGENFFQYVGFYFSAFSFTEPGTYVVSMFIPASDILNNVFDETSAFEIWLYLYDESTGFNDRLGPEYTSTYDLSMFERDAQITSISDQGVDDNGNGLYEKLEVTVTIDVNTPGDYWLDMESYVGESGAYLGFTSQYFFASEAGTYEISLYISGTNIVSQTDVEVTDFELWIFLWNNQGLADEVFGYYTNVYSIADFEYTAVMTAFDDYPVDENGNGLYEGISVEITVDVAVPGDYFFVLDVFETNTFNWIGSFSNMLMADAVGIYTVNVLISASNIIQNTGDAPTDFEVFVTMYDDTGFLQNELYYTDVYDPAMFETALQIADINDFGLDEDGNGEFEFIVLTITLDVNIADTYFLYIDMFGNDDQGYDEYVLGYRNSYDLDVNTHTLEILLPSTLIVSRLSDDYTNFLTFIFIEDSNGNEVAFQDYFTDYYSVSDLEFIVGINNVSTYGNDTDDDGLYESLVVEFEMTFFKSGDYSLGINLVGDADTDFNFIGYYETSFSVPEPGDYMVSIAVPAEDILSAPLEDVTNFFIVGVILDSTPYVVTISDPHFTDYYTLSDFDTN